jgi:hypothetical protein
VAVRQTVESEYLLSLRSSAGVNPLPLRPHTYWRHVVPSHPDDTEFGVWERDHAGAIVYSQPRSDLGFAQTFLAPALQDLTPGGAERMPGFSACGRHR